VTLYLFELEDADAVCPAESTRYSTASPLKGGVNVRDGDPAGMELPAIVSPVEGFSHSTVKVLELGIAEMFTVKGPPLGA
jgi:hypothetical protein